jgi:2-polyprenyl-6-hydroxyphenyl methylase/3-demethylubiquinone-9 3-methyltransferase
MSEVRFEFGKNWESFSHLIDEDRIRQAEDRLVALLGTRDLSGKTFLDIGCGSGLHSLAALRLGAKQVLAVDLDPDSVATTRAVMERFWNRDNISIKNVSVFDLAEERIGTFDVVYSWGVLHHTGDMNRAIQMAAAHVSPRGRFAIALYGKTRFCEMWKRIKHWYVSATPSQKARAERIYIRLFGLYRGLQGQRMSTYVAAYKAGRGMDFHHDVRDWIGGYPYESIAPQEVTALLAPLGFQLVKQNVRERFGFFGSGNDEYLFEKPGSNN